MNGETILHQPTAKIPWLQLFILMGGAFMAFLDTSIVNVAIPKLMAIFGVGVDSIQWVTTAYLLSAGVTIPLTGYFGDRLGIKNIFLISLGIFTLGSALCSVAATESFLIAARVIQAVGGGAIMPVTTSFIYQIITQDRIGLALGMRGIAMAAAPAFGPVLGGYLIDHFNWHIIFTINVPIGILIILVGTMALPRIPVHVNPRLDPPGMVLVIVGAFAVLLGLSRGQSAGWHSLGVVVALTGGLFALLVFVLWELTTDHPVIDLRIFTGNLVLAASFTATFLVTVAMYAILFLVPVFVQQILGFTAFRAGLVMAPAALSMAVVSPLSGRLFDRFGAVPLCLAGIALTVLTTLQMSHLTTATSFRTIQVWLMEYAGGLSLFMLPLTVAGLNTVPRRLMNRVTSLNSLVRQVAGSLGIAFFTYVYNRQGLYYQAIFRNKVTASSAAVSAFLHGFSGYMLSHSPPDHAAGRPLALFTLQQLVASHATARAIDYTMVLSSIITLAILPLVFFLRRPKTAPPDER
ncbi:MAG: DHA2 family efflux MFS transporter permease subunit [Peptococcaceae bacterium]|jgi:EmrB/QacA subfamily drug resistance transporter|nr:DHA2 family efflux MFS transporter permease subunit [Peptococcaceae bacterium]